MSDPATSTAPSTTWIDTIKQSFRTQLATWIVGILLTIFGVFSDSIVEKIRFSLNKADLRSTNYEALATDFSDFAFMAELSQEYLRNNWTTEISLKQLLPLYNKSIIKIRQKEYVYRSWLIHYWEKSDLSAFNNVMLIVKDFDQLLHSLNDEFEGVITASASEKKASGISKKVNPEKAAKTAQKMEPVTKKLRAEVESLLVQLDR